VALDHAQVQMNMVASGLTSEWPEFDTDWAVRLVPLGTELAGEIRPALLALVGAVALVLLIACANVANLLLARGAARHRELAVRTALGASRGQVVRQLLTEMLVLSTAGGLLGLVVARWATSVLVALSPVDSIGPDQVQSSLTVLAFTAAASIATVFICGLFPALEASRAYGYGAIGAGARQAGSAPRNRRFRHALVVSEVALAVVLLVGAALLIRSFATLRGIYPGFRARNVLTMRVSLPAFQYEDPERRLRFFRDVVSRVASLPGVRAAGAVSFLPFAGLGAATDFAIEGRPVPPPGTEPIVEARVRDAGYFSAMGIDLVRGRLFSEREMQKASNVVVVNRALVQQHFPNEDPLGKRLMIDMTDPVVPTTIIGVVEDVRQSDLATEIRPMAYWPHPQLPYAAMTLAVRTSGDPLAMVPLVEREIRTLDPDQPVSDVRSMEQWIGRSLQRARFIWTVLALFAGLALLLTSIGTYGVMSYSVRQRSSEIGVRLALGATEPQIVGLVLRTGVGLTIRGLAVGVPLALLFTRSLAALLFGVTPADPPAVLVAVAALTASYVPARRAARTNPVDVLRQD
jgi:predicted permease